MAEDRWPRGNKEKGQDPSLIYCFFCGKSQDQVSKMVACADAIICDECVDVCGDILLSESDAEKYLPDTRKRLGAETRRRTKLEEFGFRPRFKRLKLQQKAQHAFMLCPFSEPFNTIYKDHVTKAVKAAGFSVDRADEIYGTQPIIEDIWEGIVTAELIIADVTGRNPNVMYEVGMAHTVGKPVVIMTQSIDDVPFDVRHHRCVVYSHTPRGCAELEERISGTIRFLQGQRS